MNKSLDFLAIGDITTDAFIKLSDAWIETDNPKREQELCMKFAEKIPYELTTIVRAVGNAPNAAVSAARLGLSSGLVTNMGDDENGSECREVLRKEGVDTTYAAIHKGMQTNYHYVLLYDAERTILIKHEPYDYKLPVIEPSPRWIYLSSFRGNETYHGELMAYIEKHPEVLVSFQPGKFEINLGYEKLKKLYENSDLFFCNREESQKILGSDSTDFKTLLNGLHALGPKIIGITDGPKGAYAYDGHMNEYWFMPIYPDPKPPVSRTGAGDAFASTFTCAIISGKPVREALRWAPINSAYVVQEVGAQKGLLSREALLKYLENAPTDYQPKKI
ncbi:MAG: Sugar kinase, ribokinase family [Parcubacteria group bacterium GW2011_GWA2_49_9]|nr:MAG: Sugar kinase, ribokinase family [Parcubacteria group bacterium GW2011_GWA2_49_9]